MIKLKLWLGEKLSFNPILPFWKKIERNTDVTSLWGLFSLISQLYSFTEHLLRKICTWYRIFYFFLLFLLFSFAIWFLCALCASNFWFRKWFDITWFYLFQLLPHLNDNFYLSINWFYTFFHFKYDDTIRFFRKLTENFMNLSHPF